MSTPGGPSKRRRIAGESKPGTPAAKPTGPRTVKKPLARPGRGGGEASASTGRAAPAEETVDAPSTSKPPKVRPAGLGRRGRSTPAAAGADTSTEPELAATEAPEITKQSGPVPADDAGSDTRTTAATETATDANPRSGRTRPSRRAVLLTLVAVAAVVFGAVFGIRGLQAWSDSRGLQASHGEAADAAATAAEVIFGYRYDQLEEHLEESQELMTDSFAEEFESISPALNDLAPQRQIQVESTTRDAAALPCGDDCSSSRTQVLVFIDQARVADGEEQPTVFGNRVTMSMVETDGEWLVDDVTAL